MFDYLFYMIFEFLNNDILTARSGFDLSIEF